MSEFFFTTSHLQNGGDIPLSFTQVLNYMRYATQTAFSVGTLCYTSSSAIA
jgi:hypothetical protein